MILSLDQSSTVVGFAVATKEGKIIKTGYKKFCGKDFFVRVEKISNFVEELILDFKIKKILMEDVFLQRNVKTLKKLSLVIGVIIQICLKHRIEYNIIPATTWKNFLGIKAKKRKEQKKEVQEYFKLKYDKDFQEDESDSLGILLYFLKNFEKCKQNQIRFQGGGDDE